MTPEDFWSELEYRVCREIDGLRCGQGRGLWCDGFICERFEVVNGRLAATGRVWMGRGGRHQESWRFMLLLPKGVASEADIEWSALLPPEDVTGWLSLHEAQCRLTVDPAAAYRDQQLGAP